MVELVKTIDTQLLKTLVDIEISNFGAAAGLNEWMLVPLIHHGRVFIKWHENQIVGLCQYILDWEVPGKAYLVGVSVKNHVRNKGLATSLLKDSISHLSREGIREVELTVSPDNKPAIIVYQEKLGFRMREFRKDEYGPGEHRVIMNRLITG